MEDGKIEEIIDITSSLAIVPVCVAQYVSLTSDVLEKVKNIALSAEIMHTRATFNSQWFDQIVVEGSEVSFQEAFRVYKEEFFFLLNKILADETIHLPVCGKAFSSYEKMLGVTLYYLAQGCTYRQLRTVFGVSIERANTIIRHMLIAIIKVLIFHYCGYVLFII
jgi:hypothetical protein